jgi:hypothetical protein
MLRSKAIALLSFCWFATDRLFGSDPPPTQTTTPDNNTYHVPVPSQTDNHTFPPDNFYGADHGGSTFSISYPYLSPFGNPDHSRGQFVYYCAPFTPRGSEGVFGMDVWLEMENSNGTWSPISQNGGLADNRTQAYQPINTPNPGPSPSYTYTWTFNANHLPPYTNFRVFVYIYIYNQGGGSQGDYPVYSSMTVNTGAANDAPRIAWSPTAGSTNPTQVTANQSYIISADAQDDNGNLTAVSINKNGQPFAYAGGGNGFSGNSQNPTSDPVGTDTYTAWATDSYGAQSPTITWTVDVLGKSNQAAASSANASIVYYSQSFSPVFNGGSGTGGWQFVVADYTNWTGAADSNTGTELYPSNAWSSTWMPPSPGTYTFYVARDGDSNYNPSSIAGPYTLSVNPASPVGSFDGVSPNPVTEGLVMTGGGWAADAQMGAPVSSVQVFIDGGANGSFPASLGGSRPDVQAANLSWGHWSPDDLTRSGWAFSYSTTGLAPGAHTMTAYAYDSVYGVSSAIGSQSFSIDAPIGQTVTLSPGSETILAGNGITFTAGGGENGYVWGGQAGGGGSSQTVSFPSPGSFLVTVYSPAGNGYTQSNIASATITVNSNGQTVSLSPLGPSISVGGSITFTAGGGQNGYVWGGSASGSGSSQTIAFANAGTYSVTVYSPAGGAYGQSNTATATVTVTPGTQTVVLTPAAPVVNAPQSVVFSASGGMNGYVWGGSASGSGPTQTVAFANPGTFTVTVLSPAGGNFSQSNTASATVTVNPSPGSGEVEVWPKGGNVKVQNKANPHNSQVIVPQP